MLVGDMKDRLERPNAGGKPVKVGKDLMNGVAGATPQGRFAHAIKKVHEYGRKARNVFSKKGKEDDSPKDDKKKSNGNVDGKASTNNEDNRRSLEEKIVSGLQKHYPLNRYAEKAKKAFDNDKGDKYIKLYKEASNERAGIEAVAEHMKKRTSFWINFGLSSIPYILFLSVVLFVVIIIKNASSFKYRNNNGSVYDPNSKDNTQQTEQFEDEENPGVFADFPGLYQKIHQSVEKISKQYNIEVDEYIIIATLIAPINNNIITPYVVDENGNAVKCGNNQTVCYKYNGELKSWDEFVEIMGSQAELLAKMQLMTFSDKGICNNTEDTLEQIADNDKQENTFPWYEWLFPSNWFAGYVTKSDAEKNYVCTKAPDKNNLLPDEIITMSIEKGNYTQVVDDNGSPKTDEKGYYLYDKDPNSGGIYYWNLVNQKGFLFYYLKDYLPSFIDEDKGSISDDDKYIASLPVILKTADYIYDFYDAIKTGCDYPNDYHNVINSKITKIKVYNPPEKVNRFGLEPHIEVDFEDEYIGGVMLAEYNSGNDEALKAFAILARTEAIRNVGVDGEGEIENSSNRQNYNPEYDMNDPKYERITKAVQATRGLVLADYEKNVVAQTEYDAFCPVKNTLDEGKWYYLPEGQQNLPINVEEYKKVTGKEFISPDSHWLECPCFQNADGRPHDEKVTDEYGNKLYIKYAPFDEPPTYSLGNPGQKTSESCWTLKDITKDNGSELLYGWSYKPTGGHGRGASQYGLTYFGAMGYDQNALLRLFFPGSQIRVLKSAFPGNYCKDVEEVDYENQHANMTPYVPYDAGGVTDDIEGSPLNEPLVDALKRNGYTIDDLNKCIGERVKEKGYGTRDGVVAAGVELLRCTMEMTGGYTYPYDHSGGKIGQADLGGKLGVNSKWGNKGGTCEEPVCRLGLNCANFVRWALCNGGMALCDKGSASASEMGGLEGTEFFPGAVRIVFGGGFKVDKRSAPTSISSADEAIAAIKPGDVLYSVRPEGGGNHLMLIVGKDDSGIVIAENGRKTRRISFNYLKGRDRIFTVILMDGFYDDPSNKNNLEW